MHLVPEELVRSFGIRGKSRIEIKAVQAVVLTQGCYLALGLIHLGRDLRSLPVDYLLPRWKHDDREPTVAGRDPASQRAQVLFVVAPRVVFPGDLVDFIAPRCI